MVSTVIESPAREASKPIWTPRCLARLSSEAEQPTSGNRLSVTLSNQRGIGTDRYPGEIAPDPGDA